MEPIYLDFNASTPIDRETAEHMISVMHSCFANPSSSHVYGKAAKQIIEISREQVADLLNCLPEEIIFTSGGTESDNMALKGSAFASISKGNHIITSATEHPAIIEVCKYLQKNGFHISYLPVDDQGLIDLEMLENTINPETILITIMHANNETGTIQPIPEIAAIAGKYGIIFHTDAAQSIGKIRTNVKELGVNMLSLAGHKLHAPKGIGALYIRRDTQLENYMHGAGQESGLRAGTENIIGIAGLGKACEMAKSGFVENQANMQFTRDMLYQGITSLFPDVKLNGHNNLRLPNTLNLGFPGVNADSMLDSMPGIAASAGAACHSGKVQISAVLKAMHVPTQFARGSVRFSTGKTTTPDEIIAATEIIGKCYSELREKGNAPIDMGYSSFNETIDETSNHQLEDNSRITSPVIKLTGYSDNMGCSCKIQPALLKKILDSLPVNYDNNILADQSSNDDATVYKINEDIAISGTIDFVTPMVDDPFVFGEIAAANSLSDIYAMGGKP
ncbi:MAG: aminotransferase class V-fold PLP-dependent enzyme, partial [Bacteroidia bacterium]|nr:aminotransferase class V-fold PLP-dependent enzyme [Bacteroidia bacterium]